MHPVSKMKDRIDELAELMCEYKLSEAEMKPDDFPIKFRKNSKPLIAPPTNGLVAVEAPAQQLVFVRQVENGLAQ